MACSVCVFANMINSRSCFIDQAPLANFLGMDGRAFTCISHG
jgi:hypothetical protein